MRTGIAITAFLGLLLPGAVTQAQAQTARPAFSAVPHCTNCFAAPAVGMPDSTAATVIAVNPAPHKADRFHWKRAVGESFMFLTIQHSVLAWRDYSYVTSEGVPFNHYWRDYMKSLSTWAHTGWDDGDPFRDNYIAHPLQGALVGYIQIQNDPKGAPLEFSRSRRYWISRLKAFGWSAANSTQWEIGPLSEMTVEKYGTWRAWKQHGKWVNGEGQVDLVITPTAGVAYIVLEDVVDRYVIRRVEGKTGNRFAIAVTRCALNPIRGGANILHGKRPWYRASRSEAKVALQQ